MVVAREELERGVVAANLVEAFEATAARLKGRAATRQKRVTGWVDASWTELARRARDLADGLAAIGFGRGERAAILGESTTEWILADLGVMGAAGVAVPIYQSNKAHECQFILADCGARYVFCDSEAQVAKVREARDKLPELKGIIRFSGEAQDAFERTLADLERTGEAHRALHPTAHAERLSSVGLADPATLIYTSGTTGQPKGVALTHDCWVYEADAIAGPSSSCSRDHVQYLWLPLSHSFGKVLMRGAARSRVHAPRSTAASTSSSTTSPSSGRTLMAAVPRIFEKVYNRVVADEAEGGARRRRSSAGRCGVGKQTSQSARQRGDEPCRLLVGPAARSPTSSCLASSSERFGGRMRSSSRARAPLSREIAEFFRACGLLILEGYGLTETSAGTVRQPPDAGQLGTVGQPLPGTEVKIAEDGEILLARPRRHAAATTTCPSDRRGAPTDGWLHTGDIGEIDADGYLRITDRKKDLIKTSGGKYVAPQHIEGSSRRLPLLARSWCTATSATS